MKEKTIKIDFFASPDDISVCKIHAVILQQWQANNLVEIKSNNYWHVYMETWDTSEKCSCPQKADHNKRMFTIIHRVITENTMTRLRNAVRKTIT